MDTSREANARSADRLLFAEANSTEGNDATQVSDGGDVEHEAKARRREQVRRAQR